MPFADLQHAVPPEFEISVGGQALPVEIVPFIAGIVVDDSLEWPSMFALQLFGSFDLDDPHEWIDNARFAVGGEVEIKLGYGNNLERLILGEITGLEPEYVSNQLPTVTVRGYDLRHRLQRGRKTCTFVGQRDSDIAGNVAMSANLTPRATDSGVVHDYVIQANQTDLEFLRERARRINYETFVRDRDLFFRPRQIQANAVCTITTADHLLEFRPRLSTASQVSNVIARGWDPVNNVIIQSAAQTGDEAARMGGTESGPEINSAAFGAPVDELGRLPVRTQDEADQMVKAALDEHALSLIEAEGKCHGRTDIRAGSVIRIDNVGRRFSGRYYVTSAVHRYHARRGYYTEFQARRNAS